MITKKIYSIVAILAVALVMVSCGGFSGKAHSLVEKYNKEGKLSADEWTRAVDMYVTVLEENSALVKRAAEGDQQAVDEYLTLLNDKYEGCEALWMVIVKGYKANALPADAKARLDNAIAEYSLRL